MDIFEHFSVFPLARQNANHLYFVCRARPMAQHFVFFMKNLNYVDESFFIDLKTRIFGQSRLEYESNLH